MIIYLIRHGETTGDIEGRFGGDYDDHLTNTGKEQCKELAQDLVGKEIETIISSPRIRARETAEIVQKVLQIPIEEINDLRERNNYGVLSGLTEKESLERFPEDLAKLKVNKVHHNIQDSESYADTKRRALEVFEHIVGKERKVVAVISHGGIISTYVRETFGKETKLGDCAILKIDTENKSIACVKRSKLN